MPLVDFVPEQIWNAMMNVMNYVLTTWNPVILVVKKSSTVHLNVL